MSDQAAREFNWWGTDLAGGRLSEIVIVESLDTPREVATGELLRDHVAQLLADNPVGIRMRFVKVEYAREFLELVSALTSDAARGRIPLLHVECHGGENEGLEFPNGSTLSWDDLGRTLEPLNRATRFNLVTVFSACYGAHSVGQLEAVEPAPFWFMVAPTAVADPAEIMTGMRVFYRTLIETRDLGQAAVGLMACKLAQGAWYPAPAETWFRRIAEGYFEAYCTEDATTERVFRMRQQGLAAGKDVGPGRLRRIIRKLNNTSLTGRYFDSFFMVDELPENATRFQAVKAEVEARIQALRRGGQHVL